MHNYHWPLIAIRLDGVTKTLETVQDVQNFARDQGKWNENHIIHSCFWDGNHFISREHANEWIMRDDRGRKVLYEDLMAQIQPERYKLYNQRQAKIRAIAAKGLPIPGTGCSKAGWKMNHIAKKNSGSGHRNRNRARACLEEREYGVRNKLGRVIPWEHY